MNKTICYCFGYTAADIGNDVRANNGKSQILKQIAQARQDHTCQCETKHPEKR